MGIGNADEANELRWKRGTRNHYEVYYLTLNNLSTKTGFWIRYTLTAPAQGKGDTCFAVWFSFFDFEQQDKNFGITRKYPTHDAEASSRPFSLRIGANLLTNGALSGNIAGAGHSASWDLTFEPSPQVFLHFPRILYARQFTDTTVLSPHLNTTFTGTIEADGRTFELRGDPGDQTHLWGREHAREWAWAHCCRFDEDERAVMESLVAKVRRFGINLPPIHLIYLKYGDRECHLINPHEILMTKSARRLGEWFVNARSATVRIDMEITCRNQDLIEAEYFDPNGHRAWCCNTEVGSALIRVYRRSNPFAAWRREETLTSLGTTHVEWGARTQSRDVKNKLIVVD
ncbi:MAG: tocopherol cyclase family protein [bacterium]